MFEKRKMFLALGAVIACTHTIPCIAAQLPGSPDQEIAGNIQIDESALHTLDFSNDSKLGDSLLAVLQPVLSEAQRFEMRSAFDNGRVVPNSFDPDRSVMVEPTALVLDNESTLDDIVSAYEILSDGTVDEFRISLVQGVADLYGLQVAVSDDDSNPWLIGLGVLGGAAAAGGMGGSSESGGSDNGTYRDTIEAPAYLAEYQAQQGLSASNVANLNSYGYTGQGVKVAVVDTGIDAAHPEFAGRAIYGTDFGGSTGGYATDQVGHGTHVASIIGANRNASGMRGVAYDAQLYSYRTANDAGSLVGTSTDAASAAVFRQHVTDGIRVSNNSYGSSTAITSVSEAQLRASLPQSIQALGQAQAAGTLFVFSAGNETRAQPSFTGALPARIPELAGGWLVVVSVDTNLRETLYTNRCGIAAGFCVTAVGGGDSPANSGVYGAQANTGGYVRLSGTSMAAPQISGLAATLVEKFPSLSATQIANRIKASASLDGLVSYDGCTADTCSESYMRQVFGHGLPHAAVAGGLMGVYTFPRGNTLDAGVVDLSRNLLALPGGVPTNVINALRDEKFVVFDSFDGARFEVSGSQIFVAKTAAVGPSLSNSISNHGENPTGISTRTFSASEHYQVAFSLTEGPARDVSGASGFWGSKADLFKGMTSLTDAPVIQSQWQLGFDDVVLMPFAKASPDGSNFGSGAILAMRSEDQNIKTMVGVEFDHVQMSLGATSTATLPISRQSISFGAVTDLSQEWSAFGGYTISSLSDNATSFGALGLSAVDTSKGALGLHWDGRSAELVFGVHRPEEMRSGTLTFLTPTGRDREGNIYWSSRSFEARSSGYLPMFLSSKYNPNEVLEFGFSISESAVSPGILGAALLNFGVKF